MSDNRNYRPTNTADRCIRCIYCYVVCGSGYLMCNFGKARRIKPTWTCDHYHTNWTRKDR